MRGSVFDADAPSSRLAIEQIELPNVRERLFAYAKARTGSEADADDLVEEALLRVLDPDDAPWDPARGSFIPYVGYLMRQCWHGKLRKASTRREVLDGELDGSPLALSREPRTDVELDRRRTMAVWQSVLDEVLAKIGDKYPLARKVVDLASRGIDQPADQARMIPCRIEEVYRILETLQYHAQAVFEQRELAERRRMENLRGATRKGKNEAIP